MSLNSGFPTQEAYKYVLWIYGTLISSVIGLIFAWVRYAA